MAWYRIVLLFPLLLGAAQAQPLTVAIKAAEPFVIPTEEGPTGISIDLWEQIARDLDLEFEYVETDLDDALRGVESGEYDAGLAAITITPERERRVDLTHGYFNDGLGIAVPTRSSGPRWFAALKNLISPAFLSAVGALAVLLFAVGFLTWLVEHRKNSEEFGKGPGGIGHGFWFAAVTMTTVGYGDKAPKTAPGKLLALVWMFASIIIISAFTGAIASSLTAAQIDTGGAER